MTGEFESCGSHDLEISRRLRYTWGSRECYGSLKGALGSLPSFKVRKLIPYDVIFRRSLKNKWE